jgi:hypothetical protein
MEDVLEERSEKHVSKDMLKNEKIKTRMEEHL